MVVPHFLRCPWCGEYQDQHAVQGNHCQFCTGVLSAAPEQNIWLRCPICLQVVQGSENSSALSIHQSHISAERRQRIGQLLKEPTALRNLEGVPKEKLWTKDFAQRAVELSSTLESYYPNPTDCNRLFWYHHRLC